MLDRRMLKNLDFLFILFVFLLLGTSLLIQSTASYNIYESQPFRLLKIQSVWIATGLILCTVIALFDYQKLRRFSWWIYAFNIALLLAVFAFGEEAKGAQRWIPVTSTQNIQPSEFAKLFIIVTFADFLSKRQGKLNRFRDFIPPFLYILIPMLLIVKQPDLGTALVFVAILIGMMFVAGANPWKFGGLIVGGILIVAFALWVHFAEDLPGWLQFAKAIPLPLHDYQLQRLTVFLDPAADISGDGYQIIQSIWAIGSGGFWGKGYRQGTQAQLDFLPEHHTDFIFSVVGEEFGFIGTITLLFCFLIFLLRAVNIGMKAKDVYGTLVAAGIVSMFTFHILVNVGMTSGIMPVTGIPLPLISYGGSAMWANLMAIGVLLSINIRRQRLMF
ncbi:rod shape determining protein RodA [Desulfitobacterium sp. LBE]|uniref:Peptidoglycan glycosyltransferase RodA n=2 Tax=root TaxID=1 RepID=A0A0W1JK02_DESHA|nr:MULTISPECIES: rod shape-determining protein RodA [Desulfitobacterium]KTE92167.1 rod shape-determining protein RodA [Desulfitobacterium hafniense]MEA5021453.1 rod shape-determining protein RodA [Desulfitobacterium hafniense]TWH59876.1 rod shape determining protein RodA [Desulfitobacterium sp. LBE]